MITHPPGEGPEDHHSSEKRFLIYASVFLVILAFIAYMVNQNTQIFGILDPPFFMIVGYFFGSKTVQ